jgi:hypothetical protein
LGVVAGPFPGSLLYAMDYPISFVPEEVKITDELPISDTDKK